jgi:hypothetical protein
MSKNKSKNGIGVKEVANCLTVLLLGLLLNPEDEDGMFLWNFGRYSTNYAELYPRR